MADPSATTVAVILREWELPLSPIPSIIILAPDGLYLIQLFIRVAARKRDGITRGRAMVIPDER